jgi:hypothetical protein
MYIIRVTAGWDKEPALSKSIFEGMVVMAPNLSEGFGTAVSVQYDEIDIRNLD